MISRDGYAKILDFGLANTCCQIGERALADALVTRKRLIRIETAVGKNFSERQL